MQEVKDANLKAFYMPIYDPSEGSEETPVVYIHGAKPAVGHSNNWWIETASKMPTVEGKTWTIATEYQYYARVMYIINSLVESGDDIVDVLNKVVKDSNSLGHYRNSKDSTKRENFEPTGSKFICGVYNLANTFKFLRFSDEEEFEPTGSRCICGLYDLANAFKIIYDKTSSSFSLGGGSCNYNGDFHPIASICRGYTVIDRDCYSVGMHAINTEKCDNISCRRYFCFQ